MPKRTSKTGSELFIVDNSEDDWKVQRYLHDWCQLSKAIDIATGYFEIGGLLGLKDEWQKVDAKGGRLRFFRQFVENLPIPNASSDDRNRIARLVEECLSAKGIGCEAQEKEIDARVLALYGLDSL